MGAHAHPKLHALGLPASANVSKGDRLPTYGDFAYLAFTIGMTYQVSDTSIASKSIRRTALRQGYMAYLFGTVIVAMTINVVAELFNL